MCRKDGEISRVQRDNHFGGLQRLLQWDETTNTYGEILTNNLTWGVFTIITTETSTFIAANGCSKIDFMVISSNLTGKITNISTDELANLATGAPTRGHIPVWATLLGRKSRMANPVVYSRYCVFNR